MSYCHTAHWERQEETTPGIAAVILGMHRSGTSCLAHILKACGVYMGDDNSPSAADNLQGFGESPDVVAINNAILERSGGSWNQIPRELLLDQETLERMKVFLSGLRRHPTHGWKDPRTVLTFSLWQPLLSDYRLIVCFRHPNCVAQSLAVRDGLSLEEGYHLWATYNERLLESVNHESGAMWFDFDRTPEQMYPWLQGVCRELEIEFRPEALTIFNKYQRHHQFEEMPCDPRLAGLYRELLSRAQQADLLARQRSCRSSAVSATGHPANSAIESLRQDIVALADIEKKHNALLQAHTRELSHSDGEHHQLEGRLEELHAKLTNCERQLGMILESRGWKAYQRLQYAWQKSRRLYIAIARPVLIAPRLLGRLAASVANVASVKTHNLRHNHP